MASDSMNRLDPALLERSDSITSTRSDSTSRSWAQRTFSRMEAGSIRGSIFSLCSSAIGSGVLLLPYMMAQVGPLGAAVLLTVAASAAYGSLRICCAGMYATQARSYVDVLTALFSRRFSYVLT